MSETQVLAWACAALGGFAALELAVLLFLGLRSGKSLAEKLGREFRDGLDRASDTAEERQNRLELRLGQAASAQAQAIDSVRRDTLQQLQAFSGMQEGRISELSRALSERLDSVNRTVNAQLSALQQDNAQKLEQMRRTVDDRLQSSLEGKLSESFRQVSSQLLEVERGLGEMKSLAGSVDALSRIMGNVKTRGTFGEARLGALISETLAPGQYAENVETVPGSGKRVEFAVRMPGAETGSHVWLPVDAKFPTEDWERLEAARSSGDRAAENTARKALRARFEGCAREISSKYLRAPYTTDFAVMFLPSESLYAELLRMDGLSQRLQGDLRVMAAGPTVVGALFNALQMGFRTLAVQERSAEVWRLLGEVKSEFRTFAEAVESIERRLSQAQDAVARVRSRAARVGKSLSEVEAAGAVSAGKELPGGLSGAEGEDAAAPERAPGLEDKLVL